MRAAGDSSAKNQKESGGEAAKNGASEGAAAASKPGKHLLRACAVLSQICQGSLEQLLISCMPRPSCYNMSFVTMLCVGSGLIVPAKSM